MVRRRPARPGGAGLSPAERADRRRGQRQAARPVGAPPFRRRPTCAVSTTTRAGSARRSHAVVDDSIRAPLLLLCHDDVALSPDAVTRLVEELLQSNGGLLGPKLVDWDEPSRLQHVGFSVDRFASPQAGGRGGRTRSRATRRGQRRLRGADGVHPRAGRPVPIDRRLRPCASRSAVTTSTCAGGRNSPEHGSWSCRVRSDVMSNAGRPRGYGRWTTVTSPSSPMTIMRWRSAIRCARSCRVIAGAHCSW